MLPRVEYSVRVQAPVEAAFEAFQDFERLLNRGVYTEVSWIEGDPWQVGSRIRYVAIQPVRATVSAVVTSINPPHTISLLNHALGITMEQHVYFAADPKGGSQVRMTMEFLGESAELSQSEVHDAIVFVTHDTLDNLASVCRRRASSASGQ